MPPGEHLRAVNQCRKYSTYRYTVYPISHSPGNKDALFHHVSRHLEYLAAFSRHKQARSVLVLEFEVSFAVAVTAAVTVAANCLLVLVPVLLNLALFVY